MHKPADILRLPESRKLEFKEILPSNSEFVKTIVAFANDAGGEFFLGVRNKPREIVGIEESGLTSLEEKISSVIHDNCHPSILPEISFIRYGDKYIIRVVIFKGSTPPYYIKSTGVENGTYIRSGSTTRRATPEIIGELIRQRQNISYDSELSYVKTLGELNLQAFRQLFLEKTGEKLTTNILSKLSLFRSEQGKRLPTNALILLSDDDLKSKLFPFSKIECAVFKGTSPGNFIDQKTIDDSIGMQPDLAYKFILRHISAVSADYKGVYRNDRWEYPVIAIREIIRNAVIHRDYSMSGSDIKIAIFDDKIEITSPGKLPPDIDYNDMEAGQSSIRNKILAPVFKRLGIIEQWGNGLHLIADELKNYPEIGFEWKEVGMSFRITLVKKTFVSGAIEKAIPDASGKMSGKTSGKILDLIAGDKFITIPEMASKIGVSQRSIERNLQKLQIDRMIKREGAAKGGHWRILTKKKK